MNTSILVKCEDCETWDLNPQDLNTGMCLRKSPQVFAMPSHRGIESVTMFPQTRRGMGCAEGIQKPIISRLS
jgi:hypothetical protein